ncbi:MAG: LysR family transcriptional regulator [Alphaproteobacteria bacterium]|nr:LysR family transcriptional regulator [Alphaproteobacteria bacterium]MBU4040401.1 LysR family transcriptional regulator [Alphaproteobacteria bacterium]MBU4137204.1 LysR family transcriptional regulator [Alphaproteobacteria bacterium]
MPSLNALRAFEAMARLGSATRAAAELHVTHSAVSRQVKALEASLGVRLFEGPRSRLHLTAAGRELLAGLAPGFDALSEAVRRVRVRAGVTIAIHNSLAVKWLIPRLGDFERRHPDLTLELSDLPVEAVRARDADLVVRLLDGPRLLDPDVHPLAENRIGVVVAAGLEDRLAELPRLVAASHARGWMDWEKATGIAVSHDRTRSFSHLHHVLDATVSGLGAAVLPWHLVVDAVRSGELVAPRGFIPDGGQLVAVGSEHASAAVRRTILWLRAQGSGEPASSEDAK